VAADVSAMGAGRARGATAGPQGHPRPPGAGDDDGEETGARPPVESRSISLGAARSKAAEDFEGRKKNLSSDYHVRGREWIAVQWIVGCIALCLSAGIYRVQES
jgi:hypothetical protein